MTNQTKRPSHIIPPEAINYSELLDAIYDAGWGIDELNKAMGWETGELDKRLCRENGFPAWQLEQIGAVLHRRPSSFCFVDCKQTELTAPEETLQLLRIIVDELKTMNELLVRGGLKK